MLQTKDTMFDGVILMPQGDKHVSLFELITQYRLGRLQPPPHQRKFVWDSAKCTAWAESLIRAARNPEFSRPIGAMVTYQITGTGEYFLNDGWQRLNATMKFLKEFARYKLSQAQAESIAQAYEVLVQHRHYQGQTEAMYWFQVLQLGTALTTYDFCRGYLEYLDDNINWMGSLNDYHNFMGWLYKEKAYPGSTANNAVKDQVAHRLNYAMLYNWLTRSTAKTHDYASVSRKAISLTDAERGKMIEQKLGWQLSQFGLSQILLELKALQIFLEAETEFAANLWGGVHGTTRKIPLALLRWVLSVAIWRRNNGLARDEQWRLFLELVIRHSDTTGRLSNLQSGVDTKYVVLTMDGVDVINRVSGFIGNKFYTFYGQPPVKTGAAKTARKAS